MRIELNRATFVRVVQLYITSVVLSLGAAIYTTFSSSWQPFNDAFDKLVQQYFAEPEAPDWIWWIVGILALVIAIWMVASMFGLLWFKRWARTGFWASWIAFFGLVAVPLGMTPGTTTIADEVLALIGSALFGAILLLAYADGYGSDWFTPKDDAT